MKSYKTTIAGLLLVTLTVAQIAYPKLITPEVAAAITTLLVAAGLIAAKDSNVTGGTVANKPNDQEVVKETAGE